MRFGSRGPRKFVSDTSPECIDREGLERRRTGTRQIQTQSTTFFWGIRNVYSQLLKAKVLVTSQKSKAGVANSTFATTIQHWHYVYDTRWTREYLSRAPRQDRNLSRLWRYRRRSSKKSESWWESLSEIHQKRINPINFWECCARRPQKTPPNAGLYVCCFSHDPPNCCCHIRICHHDEVVWEKRSKCIKKHGAR